VLAPFLFVYDNLEYTLRISPLSILQYATTDAAELSDTVFSGVALGGAVVQWYRTLYRR